MGKNSEKRTKPPARLYMVEFRDAKRPKLWLHHGDSDILESPMDVAVRQAYYEKIGFGTRRSVYRLLAVETFPSKPKRSR